MPNGPFSNLFSSSSSSHRSSRRDAHESSSRLTGPFDSPYGDYRSASRPSSPSRSSQRRTAASLREPHDSRYNYRDLSPMRTSERPRAYENKHSYNDHRSVSPLGPFTYQQQQQQPCTTRSPYGYTYTPASRSASPPARSYEHTSIPSYGYSPASSSRQSPASSLYEREAERPPTSAGLGLYRSSAVSGGEAPRRMGSDGEYGAHLGVSVVLVWGRIFRMAGLIGVIFRRWGSCGGAGMFQLLWMSLVLLW